MATVDQLKKTGLESFSPEVRPLLNILNDPANIPIFSLKIIEKYSVETRTQLVEELIARNYASLACFHRACALINHHQLSSTAQRWFLNKGLVTLGESIRVNPSWNTKTEPGACYELASWVIDGSINRIHYPEKEGHPRYINKDSLEIHYPPGKYPKGAWAKINASIDYAVCGTYIAGVESTSQGILASGDSNALYYFKSSSGSRSLKIFYLVNWSEVDLDARRATRGVAKFLRGEIPAKADFKGEHYI